MSCPFCRPSENIPHICPMCKGTKYSEEMTNYELCKCDINIFEIDRDFVWYTRCKHCKKRYENEFKKCSLCKGEGVVWEKIK